MIAALEGAFVLARALRSTEPLEVAGALAADAVQDALDSASALATSPREEAHGS